MFRKYEKIYRIPVPEFSVKGKHYLCKKDVRLLLNSRVDIEEKLDGANTGVVRHKRGFTLQKRGSLVSLSEHEQFNYFHSWANTNYENLMSVPKNYTIYTELLYSVHCIYYNNLPDYVIVIDVWNGKRYLSRHEKENFCTKYGLEIVPLIASGIFRVDELHNSIPERSSYGGKIEGIVVKKYKKKKLPLRGKVVLPEFIKSINNIHWTRQEQKVNKITKG
jgi:ATP-dependent RNA circularization protein (DNA/RNA ligase family)